VSTSATAVQHAVEPEMAPTNAEADQTAVDDEPAEELLHHDDSNDIDDLGVDSPAQPRLSSYPGTTYGNKKKVVRKFQPSWYSRSWLEYSVFKDRCYCFACRRFAVVDAPDQDPAFISIGFANWKTALEVGRGFSQHEQSKSHLDAMAAWAEHRHRLATGQTIKTKLCNEQIQRNRYYVRSIAEVVAFLTANELAFRGDNEQAEAASDASPVGIDKYSTGDGLFLKLFEYTMQKDEKLKNIAMSVPRNAKYTSPEIQNEIISTLACMVQDKVVENLKKSDIGVFCLKCDETRDASNVEDMSVCLRFVYDGKPTEHLLSVVKLDAVDAKSITTAILKELRDRGVDPRTILSTCFDGASVMSGNVSGVQKRLSEELDLDIPYVHCYNHRLHLVVVQAMQRVKQAKNFFGLCEQLYVFFRRQYMTSTYTGHKLKRVLEQRWTGHLESAKIVMENLADILTALEEASDARLDFSVEAAGLRVHVAKPEFAFIAAVVVKVLTILQPANAILQSKTVNMAAAAELISLCTSKVEELRCQQAAESLAKDAGFDHAEAMENDNERPRRVQRRSRMLDDYLILSTTGSSECDTTEPSDKARLRAMLFALVDNVVQELKKRFGTGNVSLTAAVSALLPGDDFMKEECLAQLTALLRQRQSVDSNALGAELQLAGPLLTNKLVDKRDLQEAAMCMFPYRDAFPIIYWHYAAALTVGVSTATCENSFSCVTRIMKPNRLSMHHERKSNLTVLAFEKALTKHVDMTEFLDIFSRQNRRLQL